MAIQNNCTHIKDDSKLIETKNASFKIGFLNKYTVISNLAGKKRQEDFGL